MQKVVMIAENRADLSGIGCSPARGERSAPPRMLRAGRVLALVVPLASGSWATPAFATTTITVDLSSKIGPATHVGSGSLYGVTEKLPADVTGLIAPLHPKMFTNPAVAGAGKQQSVGGAITVAQRVAPTGAKVTLRLADWFPGWPYEFTSMSDWLDKLSQTVSQKKASGVDNYYGYEIWNEPNGTWKSTSIAFSDLWKQSYAKLRELDPDAKIIGPSISYYDSSYLKDFLTSAKANGCVPDVISWHELSGGNLTANLNGYRALEKQVGIDPLLISINEYSGKDQINDEGQPGASAPLIAKFERLGVDSACITFWDVSHPGRLGSLLATDTATNGGWWFYKWYGDMSGVMVSTTPPSPNDIAALDGFANFDETARKASVLLGGVNDGTIQVVVKGFQSTGAFGSTVHAVVERTPFSNKGTVVTATTTVSTADLTITGDQVAVTIAQANGTDGYRLTLDSLGGGDGGTTPGKPDAGSSGGGGGGLGAGGSNSGGSSAGSGGASRADAGASAGGAAGNAGPGGGNTGAGGNTVGAGGSGTTRGSGGSVATSGGGGAQDETGGGSDSGKSGCACGMAPRSGGSQALALLIAAVLLGRSRCGRSARRAS